MRRVRARVEVVECRVRVEVEDETPEKPGPGFEDSPLSSERGESVVVAARCWMDTDGLQGGAAAQA